jgi:DNA recombination protein RmuC
MRYSIQAGLNQLDDVVGKRTKAIQRKLRGVEELSDDPQTLLDKITSGELMGEEEEEGL